MSWRRHAENASRPPAAVELPSESTDERLRCIELAIVELSFLSSVASGQAVSIGNITALRRKHGAEARR